MKLTGVLSSTAIVTLCLGVTGVSAQSNVGGSGGSSIYEEITIRATKRDESIQDVPISLAAFSGEALALRGVSDAEELIQRVPNVGFVTEGNVLRNFISIRGVQNFGGTVNTIGQYVDEVNVAPGIFAYQLNAQLLDVEQIAVLRGPQGTYFGRNTSGGAIIVTTRKPNTEEVEGSVTLQYGSNNRFFGKAVVNLPVVEDKLAVRLTAFNDQNDGYLENVIRPEDEDFEKNRGGRIALRYTPTERLTIDLAGQYSNIKTGFIRFIPNGDPFNQLLAGPFGEAGLYPQNGAPLFPNDNSQVAFNSPSSLELDSTQISSNIRYEFDDFEIVSVTGFVESDYLELFDVDQSPIDLFDRRAGNLYRNYSTELRFQSLGDTRLRWQIGGIYYRDDLSVSPNDVGVGIDPIFAAGFNPTFDPSLGVDPQPILFFDTIQEEKYRGFAFFGSIDYDFTDQLSGRIGGRLTRTKVTSRFLSAGPDLDPGSDTFLEPVFVEARPGGASVSFTDFSPSFSLVYEFQEDVSAYATISKGFKEGGIQLGAESPGALLSDDSISFDAETLWSYEVGLKGRAFDNRLVFNAAAFYLTWKDLQVDAFDPDNPLVRNTQNAAKASAYGFELEFTGYVTENFSIGAAVGFTDAEYDDFEDAELGDGTLFNAGGTQIQRVPKWTANATARYEDDITDNVRGFAEAELIYRGDVFNGFENEPSFFLPSYEIVNLRAGVDYEWVNVVAYVDNVFGKRYITGITPSGGFTLVGNMVAVSDDNPQFGLRATFNF